MKRERGRSYDGRRDDDRGLRLTLASYIFLVVLQLSAFAATNVLVLLAQSLDRVSDILISLFFIISLRISSRPADSYHAFGHTRVENVAALVVSGILVFYISLETFREAIPKLLNPTLVEAADLDLALGVTVIGMAVIALPTAVLIKAGGTGLRRAQLINLLLDEFSGAVSLVALLFIASGFPMADPLGSLVVGLAILVTGILLFRENAAILIGSSPDEAYQDRLRAAALSVDGVKGIHDIRAEMIGPDTVHADLHVEVDPGTSISDADSIAQAVRNKLTSVTNCQYCEVHIDPYRPGD